MTELEEKIGYEFKDASLLKNALTHSSYANETHCYGGSNERLEFLGDAILGATVASYLYQTCTDMPEGKMSRLRAELVCEESLYGVAKELNIGENLRLGRGAELNGGRERPSILADAVEAIIAAIYLDAGTEKAKAMIDKYILSQFKTDRKFVNHDWKTELQELIQRESGHVLAYKLTGESGPDHNKVFTVDVTVDGKTAGTGSGHSKKEAEQAAARSALNAIGRHE